jgi:uncharacterized integral membrane protein
MGVLTWLIRLGVFLLMVGFALSNTDTATLRFFGLTQFEWRAPLVLFLLAFFALGALLGVLATMSMVLRRNREIAALKRTLPVPDASAPPDTVVVARAAGSGGA